MKIEYIAIGKVTPYEKNNRTHPEKQVLHIAKSIEQFGFNQPIVVDEANVVLVGHGRLLAAKHLGMEKIPVLKIPDLTAQKKRAYRILDNKLQNDSTWDIKNLELELDSLELDGFDMAEFGLDDLRDLLPVEEPEIDEDEFSGGPATKTTIKRGDILELGEHHRVLCGDSTNQDDVIKLLEGNRPVAMVTDAPYGVQYDPEWRDGKDGQVGGQRARGKVTNDDRYDWSEVLQLFSVPVLYYWYAATFTGEVCDSIKRAGYKIVSQIIWGKQNFVFGRGDYHWQHEPCLYCVLEGNTHNWQGARDQSTLWEIKNNNPFGNAKQEEKFGHGTQKPIECMARPIRNNSAKGDLIVDPFLGSGTTLLACEQLNRICYGIEIEPKYCEAIAQRYKAHCDKHKKPFQCKVNGKPYTPSPL